MNLAILFVLIFLVWFLTVVLLTPRGQRHFVIDLGAEPAPPSFEPVPASGWYAAPHIASAGDAAAAPEVARTETDASPYHVPSERFHVEADDSRRGGWWKSDDNACSSTSGGWRSSSDDSHSSSGGLCGSGDDSSSSSSNDSSSSDD